MEENKLKNEKLHPRKEEISPRVHSPRVPVLKVIICYKGGCVYRNIFRGQTQLASAIKLSHCRPEQALRVPGD